MTTYQRLAAWQNAHQLVLLVYQATRKLPTEERYGLSAQLRRSAFSVAANIAEGSAKRGPKEFRRFLDIALGSLSELRYTLQLISDLKMISEAEWQELEALRDKVGRLTWGLYALMKRKMD